MTIFTTDQWIILGLVFLLGLLVAGTVRPEATLAITNLLWVLLAGYLNLGVWMLNR